MAVMRNQEKQFEKLVCFSPLKKAKMERSCLERSPVKIQGAKRTPSKFKPFDNEILVAEENNVLEASPLTNSHGQGVCDSYKLSSSQGKSSISIQSNSEKRSLCLLFRFLCRK